MRSGHFFAITKPCGLGGLLLARFNPAILFISGGGALPFSLANRAARGQPKMEMMLHAGWRAVVLILLGVFLRSIDRRQTYWTFEDTLKPDRMGYCFLFALGEDNARAMGGLCRDRRRLLGCFALYPLPGPEFDYSRVGVRGFAIFDERICGALE